MRKSTIIPWLLFLTACAVLVPLNWTTGTKLALVVGLLFLILEWHHEQWRLYFLYQLGLNSRPEEEWRLSRKPSYRVSVSLLLNTDDILRILISKSGGDAEADVRAYFGQDDRRWADCGLLRAPFYRFQHFHDAMSGIDQVWSDREKTFVDDMTTVGDPLGLSGDLNHPRAPLAEKFKDTPLVHPLSISPSVIVSGPYDELWEVSHRHDRSIVLVSFPYHELVDLLVRIGNFMRGCEDHAFKVFPRAIQEKLDRYKFSYEPEAGASSSWYGPLFDKETAKSADYFNSTKWARREGVELYFSSLDDHVFSNEYVTIRLKVVLFQNDRA